MQVLVNVTFTNSFGKVAHINPICQYSKPLPFNIKSPKYWGLLFNEK